jgi:hypothetical protein
VTSVLTEQAFGQHVQAVYGMLDDVGEASLEDVGENDDVRVIIASANVPLDAPYQQAFFEYSEVYERTPRGLWELTDYFYEFHQRPGDGRRAYHDHAPRRHHAHCLDPRHPERDHHYRGVPVSVFEAHSEFLHWYARDEDMNCFGLFPLFP